MISVKAYFESYDHESQGANLSDRVPPPPIYSSPLNKTAYCKASLLDAVFYGTSLLITYSLASRCIGSVTGRSLPSVSARTWTVFKTLSPLFLYRLTQIFVGFSVHLACIPFFSPLRPGESLEGLRKTTVWGYEPIRFSALSSTRHQIDAMFLKKEGVDLSGPCLLVSHGNAMLYEQTIGDIGIIDLARKLNAHILVYNYAGTGRSSGLFPNGEAMAASHEVMYSVLREIGSQLYEFGWSVGGGVKWRDHFESPKKDTVAVIDYQTFRSTSRFGKEIFGRIGELAVKFLGWEYPSEEASKRFQGKHIIVQDGNPLTGEVLNDGVMFVENALATGAPPENVILINTREIFSCSSNAPFVHGAPIAPQINELIVSKLRG